MFDFSQVVNEEGKEKTNALEPKSKNYLERFEVHKAQLAEMQNRAGALEVKDQGSAELATTWGVEAARLAKEIEANEKELIEEPNRFVKAVKAAAKRYLDPLEELKNLLRGKIRYYQARVELERRKAEEMAKRASEEVQRKIDAEVAEVNRISLENALRIAEEKAAEGKRKAEEEAKKAKAGKAEMERIAKEAEEKRLVLVKQAEEEAARNAIKAPEVPLPIVPKDKGPMRGEEGGSASQRKTWLFEILNEAEVPREYLKPDETRIRQAIKMGARNISGIRIFEDSTTIFRT